MHSQGELDLMIVKDGKRLGFEFKFADSPRITPACRMAIEHLKLDQLTLVCPGDAAQSRRGGEGVADGGRSLYNPSMHVWTLMS